MVGQAVAEERQFLEEAVERAKRDWQLAQQRVDLSERGDVDEAIYHWILAEKRYMFLLNQARAVFAARPE